MALQSPELRELYDLKVFVVSEGNYTGSKRY
jgi:hypothetical protein